MSTKLTYTGAEVQALLDKIEKGDFDNAKTLEGHPASYFLAAEVFNSMFELDTDYGAIKAKLPLYSLGGITAGGVGSGGSGGGGGISYSRLDSWADYSADKSGWVLSALLGKDLDNRVSALANAGYVTQSALAPYALRSEIPSLAGYATESFVTSQGYITASALAPYALRSEIPSLVGYATESFVTSQGYITASALAPYALRSEIPSLVGYATEAWVASQGYITQSALSPYFLTSSFTKANIKSTLGISDWALASAAPTIKKERLTNLDSATPWTAFYTPFQPSNRPPDANYFSGFTLSNIDFQGEDNTYLVQLAISWGGTLHTRYRSRDSFNAWKTLAFTSDIPTKLSQLTDDVVAGKYLSVYGGTINSPSLTSLVINRNNSTGASVITFTRNSDFTHFLGFNDNSGPKWLSADYQEYPLLHSGNYADYALSVNGGTVNGILSVKSVLRMSDLDGTYKIILQRDSSGNILFGGDFKTNNMYIDANVLRIRASQTIFSGNVTAPSFIGNLTGNADSASCLRNYFVTRPTSANQTLTGKGRLYKMIATSSMTDGKPDFDGHIIHCEWDTHWGYDTQLFLPNNPLPGRHLQWRAHNGSSWGEWTTMIDSGNISSFNAGSATKLATPRTIWGQSFDGTGNISGNLSSDAWRIITDNSTQGVFVQAKLVDGTSDAGRVFITGHNGASLSLFNIWSATTRIKGNVGIGIDYPSEALHVNGNGKFTGMLTSPAISTNSLSIGGVTLTYDSVNEALCINGNMYALGGVTAGGAGISAYTSLEARVARIEQQLNIS